LIHHIFITQLRIRKVEVRIPTGALYRSNFIALMLP
jgi:hypothetical protein